MRSSRKFSEYCYVQESRVPKDGAELMSFVILRHHRLSFCSQEEVRSRLKASFLKGTTVVPFKKHSPSIKCYNCW